MGRIDANSLSYAIRLCHTRRRWDMEYYRLLRFVDSATLPERPRSQYANVVHPGACPGTNGINIVHFPVAFRKSQRASENQNDRRTKADRVIADGE